MAFIRLNVKAAPRIPTIEFVMVIDRVKAVPKIQIHFVLIFIDSITKTIEIVAAPIGKVSITLHQNIKAPEHKKTKLPSKQDRIGIAW